MGAGPPRHPGDQSSPPGRRRRQAIWLLAAGVVLGLTALTCSALGVLSVRPALALGLPAALLVIGGLIATAAPDAATGERLSFRAGFLTGSLLSRLRSAFRWPGSRY